MAMKEHGKLTERQFAGIIANTLLGAGTLLLPRDITAVAVQEPGFLYLSAALFP